MAQGSGAKKPVTRVHHSAMRGISQLKHGCLRAREWQEHLAIRLLGAPARRTLCRHVIQVLVIAFWQNRQDRLAHVVRGLRRLLLRAFEERASVHTVACRRMAQTRGRHGRQGVVRRWALGFVTAARAHMHAREVKSAGNTHDGAAYTCMSLPVFEHLKDAASINCHAFKLCLVRSSSRDICCTRDLQMYSE